MSDLSQQSGAKRTLIRSLSQFYEYMSLMLGSARQLRLRLAAVAFALGETIELQHDAHVVGQQRDLDPAAQAAERERDHRRPQPLPM